MHALDRLTDPGTLHPVPGTREDQGEVTVGLCDLPVSIDQHKADRCRGENRQEILPFPDYLLFGALPIGDILYDPTDLLEFPMGIPVKPRHAVDGPPFRAVSGDHG